MKKYVFEEYRDKAGIGSERVFDGKEEAVDYALTEWKKLFDSDKKSYLNDANGVFHVFEIEITPEQLKDYNEGYLDISLSELATNSGFPFDVFRSDEDAYKAVLKESVFDFDKDFVKNLIAQDNLTINTGRSGRGIAWLVLNDENLAVYVDTLEPLTEAEIEIELM